MTAVACDQFTTLLGDERGTGASPVASVTVAAGEPLLKTTGASQLGAATLTVFGDAVTVCEGTPGGPSRSATIPVAAADFLRRLQAAPERVGGAPVKVDPDGLSFLRRGDGVVSVTLVVGGHGHSADVSAGDIATLAAALAVA